jgi:hypothetical protein
MSNIHNAGPETKESDASIEEEGRGNENAENSGPDSIEPSPMSDNSDPTIKNH